MIFSEWEWLTLVSRWLVYLCISGVVGGLASTYFLRLFPVIRLTLLKYTLIAACVGVVATGLHFFIRVGAFSEDGVAGMYDPYMMSIIWDSPVGHATLYRAIGFGLLVLSVAWRLGGNHGRYIPTLILGSTGSFFVALSFTKTGHIAEMGLLSETLLIMHILLTVWWMGSLYPLWLVSRNLPAQDTHRVMHRFGELAVVAVLVLVVCGAALSYQLTGWVNLFSSAYGFWLLLKVALVGVILILAGVHKFILVPAIQTSKNADQLAKSIALEKVVGISILAVTTVLTTLVGPVH